MRVGSTRRLLLPVLLVLAMVVLGTEPVRAAHGGARPTPAGSGTDPATIALDHLRRHRDVHGLSAGDVADLAVSDVVTTAHNGVTNVYVQQRHHGIDVFGAVTNVTVDGGGRVLSVGSRFEAGVAARARALTPGISDVTAVRAAARALGREPSKPFLGRGSARGNERARSLSDGGISRQPIPVRLVFQPVADGPIRLAWNLTIDEVGAEDWWEIRVDADSGAELGRNNFVAHAGGGSYNVYAPPAEAPTFGDRTVVSDPAGATASPYGWHDDNGAAGAEYTVTNGNNVRAYTDTDHNNVPDTGSQPSGGAGLSFDFPVDLGQEPSTYRPAAVTNLFFWNNHIHDVFYRYGFDEAAGNFQTNNYGRGGLGGDQVQAEAQDGGGVNNANFATPPDGGKPRMQMYGWDHTSPGRDGDLDNGIIVHEYGHGVSNRLTGGPSTTSCLGNAEQPGEGWSDWFALMLTQKVGDTGAQPRGIGTYVLGQETTGTGIRAFPYSTDLSTDPRTYDTIKPATSPHQVGSVFAAMLWDVTWGLIDEHGFSPDLAAGTAGNNLALQLVVDGLKLQPCSPGFVDARDAILLADQIDNAGENQCLIWKAFAKRGLGLGADQGSATSRTDGTQAFDLPAACPPASLTAEPDFDGDGFADLASGIPGEDLGTANDAGAVEVLRGGSSGLTTTGQQFLHQDVVDVPDANESGDRFGSAVAAGDFDGDGFTDLAVGIPAENVGSVADAGAVQVLRGSASGLTGVSGQLLHQNVANMPDANEPGDRFGSVLAAGDVNGDGFSDLAVGVPAEDLGTITDAGLVQVLPGSASGLTATGSTVFHQNVAGVADAAEAGDGFGSSLAAADVGGTEFGDLAIGAPSENLGTITDAGVVHVLLGSASGLSATGSKRFHQNVGGVADAAEVGDGFGSSLAAADVAGTEFGDLAIGVPSENLGTITDAGVVHVLLGSAAGLTATGSTRYHQNAAGMAEAAEAGDAFGRSLAAADYGGTPFAGLAIGAPSEDLDAATDAGLVHVLPGSTTGLTATASNLFHQDTVGVADTADTGDGFGSALG